VVDRRKYPDQRKAEADLPRRLRHPGEQHGRADAEEEHRHHLVAAPVIREPSGRQRERAECDEAAQGERQELRVRPVPLAAERDHHRGKDQHHKVVEEMPQVDEGDEGAALAHPPKLTE
jgi:hypothetical protein